MASPPDGTCLRDFLAAQGWDGARQERLAGDASSRRYLRLRRAQGASAVLMVASPQEEAASRAFVQIGEWLAAQGLSAPQVIAAAPEAGFLLLEDLGDALLSRHLADDPAQESTLLGLAGDILTHLAKASPPGGAPALPDLTAQDWAEAAGLSLSHYALASPGDEAGQAMIDALARALSAHADGPRQFIHRDFHAGNLILLPTRRGLARLGILDFQDGQLGQAGYDLVSLVQDARRDTAAPLARALVARHAAALGHDLRAFETRCAVLGAQRALRILGVFGRLAREAGKPAYLAHLPRVWGQLHENLAHPALADLGRAVARALPPPAPGHLARILAP